MKHPVADREKYVAALAIVVLAVVTAIVGIVRDNDGAIVGGLMIAVFGVGFAREAKRAKEVPPDHPGVRWYHVAGAAAIVSAGVFFLWRVVVR